MNKQVQEYVANRKKELKEQIKGKCVTLTVIQVGNDPASNSYIKGKKKDCEEVGIYLNHVHFPEDVHMSILLQEIELLNLEPECHGIIVQLPLPPHLDVKEVQLRIDPSKDVDGFHPMSHFKPCTPMGVINFLRYLEFDFKGTEAIVVGRSDIVGKPLAQMLTDLDCTVTLAHSRTPDVSRLIEFKDLVFTAIDKIEWFSESECFKYSWYIIDIGLGVSERDHKLHGNISEECVNDIRNTCFSKVLSGTGGVGLLTRLQLVENTIQASKVL